MKISATSTTTLKKLHVILTVITTVYPIVIEAIKEYEKHKEHS